MSVVSSTEFIQEVPAKEIEIRKGLFDILKELRESEPQTPIFITRQETSFDMSSVPLGKEVFVVFIRPAFVDGKRSKTKKVIQVERAWRIPSTLN